MDMKRFVSKVPAWITKYRYPLLVLLVGLVLMTIPMGKGSESQPSATEPTVQQEELSHQLAGILGQIRGVGKVQVLLTVATGQQTIYQTDTNGTGTSLRVETVIITDSQRNQQALVSRVDPQCYRGAIIVCQGADDAAVKLAIVEAVSSATGLGADQISVMKMK